MSQLTPYVAGEQPEYDANLVKLNTNENPYPPSPKVLSVIKQVADVGLQKYPDSSGQSLKNTIADYYHLDAKQVFVGNSSDEVLAHTFQAFFSQSQEHAQEQIQKKKVKPLCFPDITYGFYPVYCKLYGINYQTIPLQEDFSLDLNQYSQNNGGIIFANPNAPSGIALSLLEIEACLKKNPDSVVVVDEAYVDFGAQTAIPLIDQYDNLLVTQTLSKSRSLAGLRVGFACGQADLIEALERVKNSFNAYPLDQLALAGACASFDDEQYFQEQRNKVIKTRTSIMKTLQDLGFDVLESKANFVFAKPPKGFTAKAIFQSLREYNIIVRYFEKPRIDEYLRITIGTDEQMNKLSEVLSDILAS